MTLIPNINDRYIAESLEGAQDALDQAILALDDGEYEVARRKLEQAREFISEAYWRFTEVEE